MRDLRGGGGGEGLPGKVRALNWPDLWGKKQKGVFQRPSMHRPGAQRSARRETKVSCLCCGINYAVNQQMSAAPCRLKPPSGKGDVIRLMYGLGLGVL